jgi:hypothetical protein
MTVKGQRDYTVLVTPDRINLQLQVLCSFGKKESFAITRGVLIY